MCTVHGDLQKRKTADDGIGGRAQRCLPFIQKVVMVWEELHSGDSHYAVVAYSCAVTTKDHCRKSDPAAVYDCGCGDRRTVYREIGTGSD